MKFKYSPPFYMGIFLVISSLILGKITLATAIIYFDNQALRWGSIIAYSLTWLILIMGAVLIGKEYAKTVYKYCSYKYYHASLKEGTKKAFEATKVKTKQLQSHVTNKLRKKQPGQRLYWRS